MIYKFKLFIIKESILDEINSNTLSYSREKSKMWQLPPFRICPHLSIPSRRPLAGDPRWRRLMESWGVTVGGGALQGPKSSSSKTES